MERMYIDRSGNVRPKKDWDRHHVFPQSRLKGRPQRKWGEQPGLLLPTFKEWHNLKGSSHALHKHVPLAPLPVPELRRLITANLAGTTHEDQYERFVAMVTMVGELSVSTSNPVLERSATQVHRNLVMQVPFILNGAVQPLEVL